MPTILAAIMSDLSYGQASSPVVQDIGGDRESVRAALGLP
jgi:hypothetical protein